MTDLAELGWDNEWAAAFATHAPVDTVPARVAIEFNHLYRVVTADGELLAQLSGRVRHQAQGRHELAAVGDWVAVRLQGEDAHGVIETVLPRRTRFSRKTAGQVTTEQVVAANIDTVFLVMGLDRDFNPRRLERYLLMAFESGARPVIVLSKADLAPALDDQIRETQSVAPGVPVHATVAVDRVDAAGAAVAHDVRVIEQHLGRGRTGTLLGSSGAGKSTLINALSGSATLKTGAVRASDSRGRHTTRHRQLIVLPGRGVLIDTPGMRELQLWDVGEGGRETYDDLEQIAADCHFADCRHLEEPRCAVKAAVSEGRLPAQRLESYQKLQGELVALDAKRDVRAQIDEKRQGRIMGKSLKQMQKQRGR